MPQLVKTKGLGEDVGRLSIHQNVYQFYFTRENTLVHEVVTRLNLLRLSVECGVLC